MFGDGPFDGADGVEEGEVDHGVVAGVEAAAVSLAEVFEAVDFHAGGDLAGSILGRSCSPDDFGVGFGFEDEGTGVALGVEFRDFDPREVVFLDLIVESGEELGGFADEGIVPGASQMDGLFRGSIEDFGVAGGDRGGEIFGGEDDSLGIDGIAALGEADHGDGGAIAEFDGQFARIGFTDLNDFLDPGASLEGLDDVGDEIWIEDRECFGKASFLEDIGEEVGRDVIGWGSDFDEVGFDLILGALIEIGEPIGGSEDRTSERGDEGQPEEEARFGERPDEILNPSPRRGRNGAVRVDGGLGGS